MREVSYGPVTTADGMATLATLEILTPFVLGDPLPLAIAQQATVFHRERTQRGNRGCLQWRRNGATKTWKTRPGEYRIPVKYGMYDHDYVTHETRWLHPKQWCPEVQALRAGVE